MNIEQKHLSGEFGEDSEDLSVGHAIKEGAHDATSDIVKYAVLGTLVLVVMPKVLGIKLKRLKERFL